MMREPELPSDQVVGLDGKIYRLRGGWHGLQVLAVAILGLVIAWLSLFFDDLDMRLQRSMNRLLAGKDREPK